MWKAEELFQNLLYRGSFSLKPDGRGVTLSISEETIITFTSGGSATIKQLYDLLVNANEGLASKTFRISDGTYQFVKQGGRVWQISLDGEKVRIVEPPKKGIPLSQFKNMKKATSSHQYQFVYKTKEDIEREGGEILAVHGSDYHFKGIVLDKLNVMHICPGGGYGNMNVDDYKKLMPVVARNLNEAPVGWVVDGRHSGDTGKNFETWQNSL